MAIPSLVTGGYRIHLSGNSPRGESVFRFTELYLPWVVRVLGEAIYLQHLVGEVERNPAPHLVPLDHEGLGGFSVEIAARLWAFHHHIQHASSIGVECRGDIGELHALYLLGR